jgi:hypothetical protein
MITIRGYDKNDTMPFCRCASNGSSRADAFVVGMSMKADKR